MKYAIFIAGPFNLKALHYRSTHEQAEQLVQEAKSAGYEAHIYNHRNFISEHEFSLVHDGLPHVSVPVTVALHGEYDRGYRGSREEPEEKAGLVNVDVDISYDESRLIDAVLDIEGS